MAKPKLFLRGLERNDFKIVTSWLRTKDAINNYTFLYSYMSEEKLRDVLVKGISLSLMSFSRKLFLVSELEGKGLVAFHLIEDIDWRNRTASIQSFFLKQIRTTKIEKDINKQLYEHLFGFLSLRKIYFYTRVKGVFKNIKPEVVLQKHFYDGQSYQDIECYGFSKNTFENVFVK